MIPSYIKEILKRNYEEESDPLECTAWIKFTDPDCVWSCYIYAMTPQEEKIFCVIHTHAVGATLDEQYTCDLETYHNCRGEGLERDIFFRPTKVSKLMGTDDK